jgi:hypothetical protein
MHTIVEAESTQAAGIASESVISTADQEAEKTRQDLQAKENLVNAFVTGK